MTAKEFRSLALSFEGAEERSHMDHPDFRVRGKIFATLAYPDDSWGMVSLTPEQQHNYLQTAPEVFSPASGAWGRQGATMVRLPAARKALIRRALQEAWTRRACPPSDTPSHPRATRARKSTA
jgi:hypothetical protein